VSGGEEDITKMPIVGKPVTLGDRNEDSAGGSGFSTKGSERDI
jgi:hypothetical protein